MLPLEHSAILLTFIKLPFVIKIFVLSIFGLSFYIGFAVYFLVLHRFYCIFPGLHRFYCIFPGLHRFYCIFPGLHRFYCIFPGSTQVLLYIFEVYHRFYCIFSRFTTGFTVYFQVLPTELGCVPEQTCVLCGRPLSLVVQLYCPLQYSPYHRFILLFACIKPQCWNKTDR